MHKFIHPRFLVAVLVVLVAGAFVGLSAAHGGSGDQVDDTCEMNHADDDCEMTHGEEDCPAMDSGMMGGMMGMGDDCPMEQSGGMMGMHGDASGSHHDFPMH